MKWVYFIDTSVMDNLLNLPGWNQRHKETKDELTQLVQQKVTLVLPVTTVIETGNHIAQLVGAQRFPFAQKFAEILRATARGQAPWEFGPPFDIELLEKVAELLPQMAARGTGGGDTTIMAAFDRYVAMTPNVSVKVWSYDSDLAECVHEIPEIGVK